MRHKIFETNSSSSHTLIIKDECEFVKIAPQEKIIIEDSEFSWGVDLFSSWAIKAAYLFTDIKDDPELIEILRSVIEDYTQTKVEFLPGDGLIDHQSRGLGAELVRGDKEDIKKFIFGVDSLLFIGNDNGGYLEENYPDLTAKLTSSSEEYFSVSGITRH